MTTKVMQYTNTDFERIEFEGFTYNLTSETIKIIQNLAEQVGSPGYIKTPQFEKRDNVAAATVSGKKISYTTNTLNIGLTRNGGGGGSGGNGRNQEITDADWESLRRFQATVIAKKEGIDGAIDQIRKHLNKLTAKTYNTLRDKIIAEINLIIKDGDTGSPELISELNKIGEALFSIASGTSFYSSIYATLYRELMEQFAFMRSIFRTNFETFNILFKKFDYCDSTKDYDKFCENNKTNEKRRAISLFYVNLMNQGTIDVNDILHIVVELQENMIEYIKKEDSKNIVEELTEVLFIIISNGVSKLSHVIDGWESIKFMVSRISQMKVNAYPSISNKTIFKHMDLLDII